jgi:hypothetical protein
MKSVFAIWALCIVLNLAFWGALIYILLHFVGKYW